MRRLREKPLATIRSRSRDHGHYPPLITPLVAKIFDSRIDSLLCLRQARAEERVAREKERIKAAERTIAEAEDRNKKLRASVDEAEEETKRMTLEERVSRCATGEDDADDEPIDGIVPRADEALKKALEAAPHQADLFADFRRQLKQGCGQQKRFRDLIIPAGAWGEYQTEPMTGDVFARRHRRLIDNGFAGNWGGYEFGKESHSEAMKAMHAAGKGPREPMAFAKKIKPMTPLCGGGAKEELGAELGLRPVFDEKDCTKVARLEISPSGYNEGER